MCFNFSFEDSFSFDSLSWPPAGTAPDWLRAFVCYGWHSQGEFFTLYPLSVYNNVLLAGERLVAIAFQFSAVELGQIRYRLALLFCTALCPLKLQIFFIKLETIINLGKRSYESVTLVKQVGSGSV